MKNHLFSRYLMLALCSLLVFPACKSGKGLIGKKDPQRAMKETLAKVEAERVQYETISISGRANVNAPTQNLKIGISYRINMHADSLIWMRVTKFGLEGIRALVTKDSIFVVDRTNNQVHISDFSLAEEYTGLKADLKILQDLMLGNLHLIPNVNSMRAAKKEGNTETFAGMKAGTAFNYQIDQTIRKLLMLEAVNTAQKLHSKTTYSNFEPYGNTQMPQQTTIKVISPDEMILDFRHRKVEINPDQISFKFRIPGGYERVVYD